jgi:hypothetical protein
MPKFAKSLRLPNLTNAPDAITNETVVYGSQQGLKESITIGESIFDVGGFVQVVNYDDTLPFVLGISNSELSISEVSVEVIIPFDDISTTITIGDDLDNLRLMVSSVNDPLTVGKYTNDCDYKYNINTNIKVYINGANGQGQVVVRLYFN